MIYSGGGTMTASQINHQKLKISDMSKLEQVLQKKK